MIKIVCKIALITMLSLPVASFSQETAGNLPATKQILEEIRAHTEGTAVWWTGHNGWLV